MVGTKPRPALGTSQGRTAFENPQSRKLVLALVLLLVAIAAVLINDRDFWFGSEQSTLEDATEPTAAPHAKSAPKSVPQTQPAPAATAKKHLPAATSAESKAESKAAEQAPAVATNRTVLPPLDVEVVAGDTHRTIHPGSNSAKLEITRPGSTAPAKSAANLAPARSAAERERISTDVSSAQPAYPMLAQHMNVQGSVVLQAIIGTDGIIEDIHVLSGPAILASAAQQAVREWHFEPVLQNGQAVETKATITVNFNIKVADNTPKTT